MDNKVFIFIAFAAGAAIGSVTAWSIAKNRYEKIAQEEIDSVKETYSRFACDSRKSEEKKETNKPAKSSDDVSELQDQVSHLGYVKYSDAYGRTHAQKRKEGRLTPSEPYIIEPEEFGTKDGYDTVSLTYYADEVLTDDADYPIENVEAIIGRNSLTHFGEYEDDAIHVRNDGLKTDYEVLMDTRNYSDIMTTTSHQSSAADE